MHQIQIDVDLSDQNSNAVMPDTNTMSKARQLVRQYSTDLSNGHITFATGRSCDKNRMTLTMAWHVSVSWYTRFSFFLAFIAIILQIVAFTSPYWMLVTDAMGTSYSGLWTVCIFETCGDFLHHSMFGKFIQSSNCKNKKSFALFGSNKTLFSITTLLLCVIYIVACQRGGVSNKPPGLQAATRHGPGILVINYQKLKKTDRLLDPFY